jgi:3'-phosphoadenosine 5'-phosphosulfate sulfotransferase (PAPS reductase)/FAD synthetase
MANKFISFSGGVESTTMCILYGRHAIAIFSDTKAEHEKMYERLDKVEKQLTDFHDGDFKLIRVINEQHKSLIDYEVSVKYMPTAQMRYCTRIFKIKPINDFLSKYPGSELMIGLNVDEANSREGNYGLIKDINYTYPLVEDGYTRDDCEQILMTHNLHPNFPSYMQRGGCKNCFFKSRREYKSLYFLNKKEFMEVMEFEIRMQKGDRRKGVFSILGTGELLSEIAKECEKEFQFMGDQDWGAIYKQDKKETSCGLFCHR